LALKELTKNTFILALPKVINFFLKLARAKLNAVFIGTEGVGIVNQLNEVLKRLGSFSTLSLNSGAKKLIVDYNKDRKKQFELPKITGIFTLLVLGLVTVIFVIGLFFLDDLSSYFLKNQPKELFLIAFLVFPLLTMRSVPTTILNGLMEFKSISKSEITVTVIAFITFVPLVIYFGIKGAIANLVITNILFLLVFSYFTFYKTAKKRGQKLITFKKLRIEKSAIREFATISSASTFLGVYAVFCHLAIRGILASHLGMEKIGVYAPILAWSGFFSSFFVPALLKYIYPKYGMCETNEELKVVANDGFRLVSFIILPFVVILIAFKDILIPVFYSGDFIEAAVYLPVHFIGIFFDTWKRILRQIMIPTGRIKQLVPFAFIETSLYLLVIYLFVDAIGLWSWALRWSLIPLIIFISFLIYHFFTIKIRIYKGNIALMLYGLLASSLIYFFTLKVENLYLLKGAMVLGLISLLYFFLKKHEKQVIYQYANKYINKIKQNNN
jgi:PST family polysaccharide transporter